MTIAIVSDFPSMFRRKGHTNNAIKPSLPYISQAFFPIIGVLLCALAMTSAFLFVQSTLLIGP